MPERELDPSLAEHPPSAGRPPASRSKSSQAEKKPTLYREIEMAKKGAEAATGSQQVLGIDDQK
jgi:hypothetical protein